MVCKAGMVLHTRARLASRSARDASRGEQGITEAAVRHLHGRYGDRVFYFGRVDGELPCEVVEPDVAGISNLTTGREQRERWEVDLRHVEAMGPVACLQFAGYSAGSWRIGRVQPPVPALRYLAPQLNVVDRLDLPRAVVCNDVRSYPKEVEMGREGRCTPVALLDQRRMTVRTVIGGRPFRRVSVPCGAETWVDPVVPEGAGAPPGDRPRRAAAVQHAHILTGNRDKSRDPVFRELFRSLPDDFRCWGAGWEHFSGYDEEGLNPGCRRFPGPVRLDRGAEELARTVWSPVVSPAGGYATNKPKFVAACGCVPVGWRGPGGFELPEGPWPSVTSGDELADLIETIPPAGLARDCLAHMRPRWETLDALCDELLVGRGRELGEEFGGYFP